MQGFVGKLTFKKSCIRLMVVIKTALPNINNRYIVLNKRLYVNFYNIILGAYVYFINSQAYCYKGLVPLKAISVIDFNFR